MQMIIEARIIDDLGETARLPLVTIERELTTSALGMSLAEGKGLLASVQKYLASALVALLLFCITWSSASAQIPTGEGEQHPSPCFDGAAFSTFFVAQESQVSYGQTVRLDWNIKFPENCEQVVLRLDGEMVDRAGFKIVTPRYKQTYTLEILHDGIFSHSRMYLEREISVLYPSRLLINAMTPRPSKVLLGVLSGSRNLTQVVELCNVNIDLTGYTEIEVRSNFSLIASPNCERSPRRPGPSISVSDNRNWSTLFLVSGDNVLISGFRLIGPSPPEFNMGGNNTEHGIRIEPAFSLVPLQRVEISNMEISGWSGAAIDVRDTVFAQKPGRLTMNNPGAITIRNNYIHHNRHGAGWGYGVNVGNGGYAVIERNVFDWNRHAISGDSKNNINGDFSGYIARHNLILNTGGEHDADFWGCGRLGWGWFCESQTHQIDMHGDDNEFYSDNNWQCGTAGESIAIENNTILYDKGKAIKIRGNPKVGAVVRGNVFSHSNAGSAISQNGECGIVGGDNVTNPIDIRDDNVFGQNPMLPVRTCDFLGDGVQETFIATGANWWARSPITGHWRFLNDKRERAHELVLQRVDEDTKCDVAKKSNGATITSIVFSMGGTSEWTTREFILRP
jgi:hypothetical protein